MSVDLRYAERDPVKAERKRIGMDGLGLINDNVSERKRRENRGGEMCSGTGNLVLNMLIYAFYDVSPFSGEEGDRHSSKRFQQNLFTINK